MSQMQAIPLGTKTEEYVRIKYLLQLSLHSTKVEDVRVWKVDNPHLTVQFEKRTQDMLCLDSWVDATALSEQNSVQNVFSRGFKFPSSGEGMGFSTGNIQLDPANGGAHQFLYCHMGVGKSYVMDDVAGKKIIPPSYDSIYVQPNLDRDGDGKFSMEEYEAAATHDQRSPAEYGHNYVMLDPTQVVARYLVEFFYDEDASHMQKQEDDDMYDRYDFFDPILYTPVSFRDKMVGSHSSGENATHKLIGISDAYETAKAASLKQDPILQSRATDIKRRLTSVDEKLRQVNKNSAEVEEQIYQMLQEALFQLQDETQRKMNKLLGEELELRRQLEQIGWVDNFLNKQRTDATPVQFLEAWKNHLQLRDELHELGVEHKSVLDTVHADLVVDGNVQVVVNGSAAAAYQQQPPIQGGMGMGVRPPPVADATMAPVAAPPPPIPAASVAAGVGGGVSVGGVQSMAASPAAPASASRPPPMPSKPLDASQVASKYEQYSMAKQAERKMRQLALEPQPGQYFADSQILAAQQAVNLFFCLPFMQQIPRTELLYASWRDAPHVTQLLQNCMETYSPSIVLVQANGMVFGGYATDSWQPDGKRFGTPKSFLFSVTLDRKIPFHGRQRDHLTQTKPEIDPETGYQLPLQHDCLWATQDKIGFGIKDLVLCGDFTRCVSELENSYGFGLQAGGAEAKSFLAGAEVFKAEAVEVWQIA